MRAFVSIACTLAVIGAADMAAAQGKGGPKVKTTVSPTAMKPAGSTAHGKSATSKPASAPKPTSSVKTTTTPAAHGGGKGHLAETKGTGHTKPETTTTASKKAGKATTTAATSTTGSTSGAATGVALTPVQQKLQRNATLSSRLQSRLPAGTDVNTAAAGFRNLGQFVAAVNVSNNLGLDFTTLKTAMVTDGKSLGQAIQSQKGTTVDAPREAQRAEHDADTMIRVSENKDSSEKAATVKKDKTTTTERTRQ